MKGGSVQGNRTGRRVGIAMCHCAAVAFLLVCWGCWTSVRRLNEPTPIRPDDAVWIWSGAQGVRWHDVVMNRDSVTGIPFPFPPSCYECRRGIPRTAVDSIVDVRPGVTQHLVKYGLTAAGLYAFLHWYVFNPRIT